MSLAQLLTTQKENPFKVKAYRRAAKVVKTLSESVDHLVRANADLTGYAGIGKGISGAIQEIVLTGTSQQLQTLRTQISPELAALSKYPRLDPARVLRIYKKLHISTVDALKHKLASGEIAREFGVKMEEHVRQALAETREMLLSGAGEVAASVENFLLTRCPVTRAAVTGDYRRRVETIGEIAFLIESANFPAVLASLEQYGGKTNILNPTATSARLQLSSGILLSIQTAEPKKWGLSLLLATGSGEHLRKLANAAGPLEPLTTSRAAFSDEAAVYRKLGLRFIEPELREGNNEIELASQGKMPALITGADIRGELHAHSTSSDGVNTIEQMAQAALARGYEYTGITDHSQSLKIAHGLSEESLWKQIRYIDKLNRTSKIKILKSAEVDILADGSLDYPNELLKELDYTVCSIHSKFSLGKTEQTERILRAMDNPYFTILGHATGRKLLKRPGYEIDIARVVEHARKSGCFVEINSSPDRLDVSAANARIARDAGLKLAISTDAHSIYEYGLITYGISQARRAGLQKDSVLNSRTWPQLQKLFKRR